MRWPRAGKAIENIVEGKRAIPSLGDLSPDQQEIMCSEFLRTDTEFGLPKLAHLVLPVGRTMRGIDICGISSSGSVVFAQVTYLGFDHCGTKLDTLRCYRDGQGNALVLFCDCEEPEYKDGIHIIPLRKVYDAFVATTTGKLWLERATNI